MNTLFAIHGAYSSPAAFSHLRHLIGDNFKWTFFDYSLKIDQLDEIINSIPNQEANCHVIGHSMGGLIALSLAEKPWVKSVTTISCPMNGIDLPFLQMFLSRGTFMKDVSKYSNFIKYINEIKTKKPIQHIVSTSGFNPWIYEPNDGVITVKTQTSKLLGSKHEIPENHFEILLSEETARVIKNFITDCNLHDNNINDII